MVSRIFHPYAKTRIRLQGYHFLLAMIAACALFLQEYVAGVWPILVAGLLAIGLNARPAKAVQNAYAFGAVSLFLVSMLVPVATLLFFATGLMAFYCLSCFGRSVGFIGVTALFLASPAFNYVAEVFSFPIRFQLAEWVSGLLQLLNSDIVVKGNTIVKSGQEFSVDPACMGLHMLSLSMLFGIVIMGTLLKRSQNRLMWWQWLLFLAVLFVLNLFSNLMRMLLLVQFVILPSNWLHEATGIGCVILYAALPTLFVSKWVVSRGAHPDDRVRQAYKPKILLIGLLVSLSALSLYRINTVDTFRRYDSVGKVSLPGYTTSLHQPGILKVQNEKALIYLKFIRGFYDTDHNPAFCWKGSGYEFKNVSISAIDGVEVYTAKLLKSGQCLYTSWWYGTPHEVFTSQWQWRWAMFRGATNYALMNVTAASETDLLREIKSIRRQKLFRLLYETLENQK